MRYILRLKRIRIAALLAVTLWTAAACAWFGEQRLKTPAELASEGMEKFRHQDYADAIELFTTLKERYPYSRYAILAELKLADAYFHRENYPEAIAAYEDFSRLHPKNEAIPYVLFQIGECYYRQLLSHDRDQSATRQAIQAFRRVVQTFPATDYGAKAARRIRACRERLAAHEAYVGRFYLKSKHYRAALARFRLTLDAYGDVLSAQERSELERLVQSCQRQLAAREPPEAGGT